MPTTLVGRARACLYAAASSAAVQAAQLLATAPSPAARVRFSSPGCLAAWPPALSKVTRPVRPLVRPLASSAPSRHRSKHETANNKYF